MSDIYAKVADTLLSENVPSSQAAEVIGEVRQEIENIKARLSEVEAQALDPLTDQAKAMDLLREKGEALFLIDRLSAGLARLEEVHAKALYREDQGRRLEAYEAAQSKMADVETALASRYPQLAKELRLLLTVSMEAMIEVQNVNQSLPDDRLPIPIPPQLCGDSPLPKNVELPRYWKGNSLTLIMAGNRLPRLLLDHNQ
jgi:hypothetical protein